MQRLFVLERSEAAERLAQSPELLATLLREYASFFGEISRHIPDSLQTVAPEGAFPRTSPLVANADGRLEALKIHFRSLLWHFYHEKTVSPDVLDFLHGQKELCRFVFSSYCDFLLAVIRLGNSERPGIIFRCLEAVKLRGNIRRIEASGYFDAQWYQRTYQNAGGIRPARHYLQKGWREGFEPGPGFSGNAYLRANPDVLAAQRNPLVHYIMHGKAEGRLCFPDHESEPGDGYWFGYFNPDRTDAILRQYRINQHFLKQLQEQARLRLGHVYRQRSETTRIVIHHSATSPQSDVSAKDIDRVHRQRGFARIGYHYFIRRNGEVETGRRPDEVGAHVKGHNAVSVGVCLAGGVSMRDTALAENNFTHAQWASLEKLIAELTLHYPEADVVGHKDLNPATQCPAFDVTAWWRDVQRRKPGMPHPVFVPATRRAPVPGDCRDLRERPPATTAFMELRRLQLPTCCAIRWTWAPWETISPFMKNAVVFTEDDSFWTHKGVNFRRLQYLLRKLPFQGQPASGASTITQQVAKNLYLSPDRTIRRKAREILLALRLERTLSKQRILELYLNIAEWGPGIFGITEASRYYFNCGPAGLSALQAAQLAVILPAPLTYSFEKTLLQGKVRHVTAKLEMGHFPSGLPQTLEKEFRDQHYHPLKTATRSPREF